MIIQRTVFVTESDTPLALFIAIEKGVPRGTPFLIHQLLLINSDSYLVSKKNG